MDSPLAGLPGAINSVLPSSGGSRRPPQGAQRHLSIPQFGDTLGGGGAAEGGAAAAGGEAAAAGGLADLAPLALLAV